MYYDRKAKTIVEEIKPSNLTETENNKIKFNAAKDYYEKRGSKSIHYEYFQTTDVNWYFDKKKWEKLNSIGVVKKTIDDGKEIKIEMRYYISSLFCDIKLRNSVNVTSV